MLLISDSLKVSRLSKLPTLIGGGTKATIADSDEHMSLGQYGTSSEAGAKLYPPDLSHKPDP